MHPPTALLIEGPFASDAPDQISTKVERSADIVSIVKYVSATRPRVRRHADAFEALELKVRCTDGGWHGMDASHRTLTFQELTDRAYSPRSPLGVLSHHVGDSRLVGV